MIVVRNPVGARETHTPHSSHARMVPHFCTDPGFNRLTKLSLGALKDIFGDERVVGSVGEDEDSDELQLTNLYKPDPFWTITASRKLASTRGVCIQNLDSIQETQCSCGTVVVV